MCQSLSRVAILLLFAFLSAETTFGAEYIFPQVADGKSSNLAYVTTFLLNNVLDVRNTVTISFFQSNAHGSPWALGLRSNDRSDISGRNSSYSFALDPHETVNVFTTATDPIGAGWARIQSSAPLEVSEIFSAFRPDLTPQIIMWEAGVLANATSTQFSFEGNFSQDETVAGTLANTGYAIANPNDIGAAVTARLFSRTGTLLSQKTINLDAHDQIAEFLNQRFSDVSFSQRFHGTIRLTSDYNVGVCALRASSGPNGDVYSACRGQP